MIFIKAIIAGLILSSALYLLKAPFWAIALGFWVAADNSTIWQKVKEIKGATLNEL